MNKIIPHGLLGALLCSTQVTKPIKVTKEMGFAGILGAAAAALGYYLLSETDEQAIENGQKAKNDAKKYQIDVDGFRSLHHITSPYTSLSDIGYYEDSELAPFGLTLIQRGTTGRAYIKQIGQITKALQQSKDNLAYRIDRLESSAQYDLLRRMKSLYNDIKEMLPYFQLYHTFLEAHKAYFDLGEYLYAISIKYKQENFAYTYHRYDPIRMATAIKQAVGSHTNLHGQFKLIAYKSMLDNDMQELYRYTKALSNSYPTLYTASINWEDFFKYIRGVILADPDYNNEVHEQQWQKEREKDRAIAKKEAKALERVASAKEDANLIELAKLLK
ncbi:MAG TPA: hypothetical protein VGW78_05855 [Candidatus Babeliales bacterium]|jgi:hypothetical protein|nr:hypothetical protein [Candidatus Babeliales bacterium]